MKNESPLVSIIVLTYNSSKYVLETLESAKAQTYPNIELIVSDDCSSDNTVAICSKWIEENKECFIRTEMLKVGINTGTCSNANRGAKNANGQWLKFIAGDDILLSDCISFYVERTIHNTNICIAASNVKYIDEQSEKIENYDSELDHLRDFFSTLSIERQKKEYARLPFFLNTPTFFLNREFLSKIDWFDERFQVYEDMSLIYKALNMGYRIHIFKKDTVKYRISNNSLSRIKTKDATIKKNKEHIMCFNIYRRKLLNKWNIVDLSVFFEFWLQYQFKGVFGKKCVSVFNKISFYYWYKKFIILFN